MRLCRLEAGADQLHVRLEGRNPLPALLLEGVQDVHHTAEVDRVHCNYISRAVPALAKSTNLLLF